MLGFVWQYNLFDNTENVLQLSFSRCCYGMKKEFLISELDCSLGTFLIIIDVLIIIY